MSISSRALGQQQAKDKLKWLINDAQAQSLREVDAEVEALLFANPDMKRATAQKRVQRARKAAVIKQQEPPQPIIVPELTPSQRRDIVNYRRLDWDDDRVAAALFLPVDVVAMVV
jgi:hypothetical protein